MTIELELFERRECWSTMVLFSSDICRQSFWRAHRSNFATTLSHQQMPVKLLSDAALFPKWPGSQLIGWTGRLHLCQEQFSLMKATYDKCMEEIKMALLFPNELELPGCRMWTISTCQSSERDESAALLRRAKSKTLYANDAHDAVLMEECFARCHSKLVFS